VTKVDFRDDSLSNGRSEKRPYNRIKIMLIRSDLINLLQKIIAIKSERLKTNRNFLLFAGILQIVGPRTLTEAANHRQGKIFLTESRKQDQGSRRRLHLESLSSFHSLRFK
jgi:hypothetical protein